MKPPHGSRVILCELKDVVVPEPDDNKVSERVCHGPGTVY